MFWKREALRITENMAAQQLIKQQAELIKYLQDLSKRQVIKKVESYRFKYMSKRISYLPVPQTVHCKVPSRDIAPSMPTPASTCSVFTEVGYRGILPCVGFG